MKHTLAPLAVSTALQLVPMAAAQAADAPVKTASGITQELLNSIHVTPKLIFDPFPAYAEKYLPFAMAASMEVTHGGRVWTCWAGGQDGPNAYLIASYSDDQGKSWRDPVFVIDPQAHGLKMGTRLGAFWCDPKGRLWLFFHQSVGMFDGSCSNWFVRCDDPDAEKPVWTEPVYIGFGASLNKPIVRRNGEWILPVSLWERWHIDKPFADCYHELDAVRGANVFVSDDEGAHWRYRGGIIFKDSCFNEHSVVELDDGRLWMLSRGMKEALQSFSDDGGKTWQPQSTAFPHVNSKCVFRRLQSGNLLLVKHGTDFSQRPKDSSEAWNWGEGRSNLTAFLSTDDGKTWSGSLLLDERHTVSYPDIAQAPNGDIYVHYDRNRNTDAEILFARFREEDVKAGKLVSAGAALKNLVKSKLGMNRGQSARDATLLTAAPESVAVFRAGDSREYRYYRLPSIAVSAGGTALVACEGYLTEGGDWAGSHILLRRSVDGGKSWLPPQVLATTADGQLEKNPMATAQKLGVPGAITFDNAVLIADRNGAVHLLYCVEYMRCFHMRSDDDGATFTPAVEITAAFEALRNEYPWKVLAVGPGHGIQLRNGRLVAPVWISPGTGNNAHHPSVSATIYSDDHGRNWKAGEIAIPDTAKWVNPNEGTMVELADGHVLLDVRTISTNRRRLQTVSPDGTGNWSKPEFHEQLYEPICAASMIRLSGAGDGRRNRLLFVNPYTPGVEEWSERRRNLTVRVSYDEGRNWPVGKTLEPGYAGYSDLAVMPDGTILCVYEAGDPARLTVARFSLEWLTDGQDSLF